MKVKSEPKEKVRFHYPWCKNCHICVALCPHKALDVDNDRRPFLANPEGCNLCGLCQQLCPDFAINVSPRQDGTEGKDAES